MSAKRKKKRNLFKKPLIALLIVLALLLSGYFAKDYLAPDVSGPSISMQDIPEFAGEPYVVINDGVPYFTEDEITTASYERYSKLDELGRCGVAIACIGVDLMPTEDREPHLHVEPSGWNQAQYDCVPGKYLYNRCHLIGFRLTAENDNEKNLITGTRYLNIDGMYDFEEMVDHYITETENHVMYRVTPIYKNDIDLVPWGVLMEGYSVEDNGDGVQFNVFCYNVQPGVVIDYYDGSSWLDGENPPPKDDDNTDESGSGSVGNGEITYILNTSSKKFHKPTCSNGINTSEKNKQETTKTREEVVADGYQPCGNCDP